MTYFVRRKLKDGRKIRSRYSCFADKVLVSLSDFESLLDDSDVAYEQAKQLQTIIENLEEIKAEAVRKALDKIRAEIKENRDEWIKGQDAEWHTYDRCLCIIDKYAESEG